MGLRSRLQLLLRSKATAAMDRIEDPRETLDYAAEEQHDLLLRVRRGLVEVATSKHQIARQTERTRERIPYLEDQAQRAVAAGRDDLARTALQRRQAALIELENLERQLSEIGAEEDRLIETERTIAARIEEFAGRRKLLAARYVAAEARVNIVGAMTGISGELAELGRAVVRAEEKTDRMQARAAALEAILDHGRLETPDSPNGVEQELRRLTEAASIETELAALKRAEYASTRVCR